MEDDMATVSRNYIVWLLANTGCEFIRCNGSDKAQHMCELIRCNGSDKASLDGMEEDDVTTVSRYIYYRVWLLANTACEFIRCKGNDKAPLDGTEDDLATVSRFVYCMDMLCQHSVWIHKIELFCFMIFTVVGILYYLVSYCWLHPTVA